MRTKIINYLGACYTVTCVTKLGFEFFGFEFGVSQTPCYTVTNQAKLGFYFLKKKIVLHYFPFFVDLFFFLLWIGKMGNRLYNPHFAELLNILNEYIIFQENVYYGAIRECERIRRGNERND